VFITTESGSLENIHANKDYREPGQMLLISPHGETEYLGKLKSISGRGQYSWTVPKKPYNLNLEEAADLLSLGAGRRWCLIASYTDNSFIRHKLVYDLAKAIGMAYTPRADFVDLFINGEYMGLYMLCTQVTVGENRVEITDLEAETEKANRVNSLEIYEPFQTGEGAGSLKGYDIPRDPADITGGYLFYMEMSDRYSNRGSGFITGRSQHILIKSPEHASARQVEYLSSLVQEFEDAIYAEDGINPDTGRSFTEYIDLESWAKKYLIEEFSINFDAGTTSQYLYKDVDSVSPLIYAGPAWDYDHSIGNIRPIVRNPHTLYAYKKNRDGWYGKLYEKPAFYQKVVEIYEHELLPAVDYMLKHKLDEYYDKLQVAAGLDYVRWNRDEKVDIILNFNTYKEDYDYIREFLTERVKFLNRLWLEGITYHSVTLAMPSWSSIPFYYFDIEDGKYLPAPLPEIDDEKFAGWYYDEAGEIPFDPSIPITGDLVLYPKFSNG
jgi:hypothetical protein